MCCGSVCSGGSSGTGGMDCVLEDVSNTILFSLALCVAAVCAVGILVGLVGWIVCGRMFLILCCCLLPVCVAAPFAVGVLAEMLAWFACWRMFLIFCCFVFPSLCDFCVSSGVFSGTSGVDCVLEDVSNTRLFYVA